MIPGIMFGSIFTYLHILVTLMRHQGTNSGSVSMELDLSGLIDRYRMIQQLVPNPKITVEYRDLNQIDGGF